MFSNQGFNQGFKDGVLNGIVHLRSKLSCVKRGLGPRLKKTLIEYGSKTLQP